MIYKQTKIQSTSTPGIQESECPRGTPLNSKAHNIKLQRTWESVPNQYHHHGELDHIEMNISHDHIAETTQCESNEYQVDRGYYRGNVKQYMHCSKRQHTLDILVFSMNDL